MFGLWGCCLVGSSHRHTPTPTKRFGIKAFEFKASRNSKELISRICKLFAVSTDFHVCYKLSKVVNTLNIRACIDGVIQTSNPPNTGSSVGYSYKLHCLFNQNPEHGKCSEFGLQARVL